MSRTLALAPSPLTRGGSWRALIGVALALVVMFTAVAAFAAAPKFPALTGRVVDNAQLLSPETEQKLDAELAGLEQQTGRQVVVATLPDLQGYEIEEYGYQLGRAWAIGQKGDDNGALFIVAPNERKVRIEAGYGLEGVLTDALSSVIIQRAVVPEFKAGNYEQGIVNGTNEIVRQLALPDSEARANVAQAADRRRSSHDGPPVHLIVVILVIFFVMGRVLGGGRRRRRGGIPWIVPVILGSGGGRGGWGDGGGFSGGGFSGGGGSFGGGGASGSW